VQVDFLLYKNPIEIILNVRLSVDKSGYFMKNSINYISYKFDMRLDVDERENRLYLEVNEVLKRIYNEVYWDFNDLKFGINKLNKLFVVFADSKIIDDQQHFYYNKGFVYLNLNFDKFLLLLKEGKIMFNLRMGVHKSGKNYGKPHDHGSGFRIKKENLVELYDAKIEL